MLFRSLSLDGLDCSLVRGPEAGGPYDLAVVYDLRADHLAVRLEIRRDAAPPETRAALARAWRRCLDFLAEAAEGGTRTLGELDLSRPIRAVAAGPARETPPLDPRRRIAAVAAADPDRVATGDRGGTTSYGALLGQVDARRATLDPASSSSRPARPGRSGGRRRAWPMPWRASRQRP